MRVIMCVCIWVLPCMAGPAVVLEDLRGLLDVQQVDLTPITDLFADVTGAVGGVQHAAGGCWGAARETAGLWGAAGLLGCSRALGVQQGCFGVQQGYWGAADSRPVGVQQEQRVGIGR